MTTLSTITVKNGEDFTFDNQDWCEETMTDDLRGGFLTWNDKRGMFLVFFNGVCIWCGSTARSARARVEKLMDKWNCAETDRDQF